MALPRVWEDREIRFDLPGIELQPRSGEKLLMRCDGVEDTKGNAGDSGTLSISNLRVVWNSHVSSRISLSIGYNCIMHVSTKIINSKLMGVAKALYILTRTPSARYEFIFTNLDASDILRHYNAVLAVYKAYSSSRLFRELRLRGAIFHAPGQLRTLKNERILNTLRGIWNLASDQGSLGTMLISNIRVVWFAEMNEHFNISLPFLQIKQVRIRNSKFGDALVLATQDGPGGGGYVLGFRVDPAEKLQAVCQELTALHKAFTKEPDFGVYVDFASPEVTRGEEAAQQIREEAAVEKEVQEIDDRPNEMSDALVNYYAAGSESTTPEVPGAKNPVSFCSEFGLAIETPKEGFSVKSLWEVLTNDS
ncbi:Bardet-Biedl syndrome 5 protein homolog [Neocloeon triangulifer]|uniref:Bardet-Biedl syndrome 5 protein homolog n=1 Tax=Neocloeon triangulifer TaxID=2078957 RepID=UPI00286ED663|nr:Bardet-Biedl syndrome 5 protein homolog [Neocloeon triangulifer]